MPRAASGSTSVGHPGPRRDPHHPSVVPVPSAGTTSATLLLNATYEPLCVVSSRRAIVLVLAGKAVVVAHGPNPVVGGTLMTGGYGNSIGVAIGAFIFGMTSLCIVYAGWDPNWFRAFLGVMLLLAVLVNLYIKKLSTVRKVG